MKNNRLIYLDSLRGIAALSVVIFHCLISFNIFYKANYERIYDNSFIEFLTRSPLKIIWSGKEPVLFFFVLSGFVLSFSLFRKSKIDYKKFVIKRFIRIYIPYIVVMMLSSVLVMLFYNYNTITNMSPIFNNRWSDQVSLLSLVSYILMFNIDTANVNGVVWTLYHEIRISLLLPLFIIIMKKNKVIIGLIQIVSCLLIGYLVFSVLSLLSINEIIKLIIYDFRESFYYAVFFLIGVVLAQYNEKVIKWYNSFNKPIKLLLFVISLLLISNNWLPIYIEKFNSGITGIGIALLFICTLGSKKIQSILNTKPLLFLGKISFSLYLTHIIVLMILAIFISKFIGMTFAILLTIPISIIFAALIYKMIEEPTIKLSSSIR